MKLGRTLVISLLFFVAVALFLFQRRIDKDVLEIVPDEVSRGFVLAPAEQIVRIEILDRVRKTSPGLELSGSGWVLTDPVSCPADLQTVRGLVLALQAAAQRTRIRAEKDWGEYGLEKPDLEVTLVTNKKKTGVLAFGFRSPVGSAVYGRWVPERGYIFLPPEVKSLFETSLFALREKRIFRTPSAELRKVSIALGANAYQWKKEGGKWYWFEPVAKFGVELAAPRMELVLQALYSLHIKEFLEIKKSDPQVGLQSVKDRIKLEGEDAEEILRFGNEVPRSNAYYGVKDEDEEVFLVDRVNIYRLLDVLRAVENESMKLPN